MFTSAATATVIVVMDEIHYDFPAGRRSEPITPMNRARNILVLCMLFLACTALAKGGAAEYLRKPDTWFGGDDARRVAANILSWQSELGGWPKNQDTTAAPY